MPPRRGYPAADPPTPGLGRQAGRARRRSATMIMPTEHAAVLQAVELCGMTGRHAKTAGRRVRGSSSAHRASMEMKMKTVQRRAKGSAQTIRIPSPNGGPWARGLPEGDATPFTPASDAPDRDDRQQ